MYIEREINMKGYESFSEKDTKKIGFLLAEQSKQGEIYCLKGDLGAGKTIFAKGFAQGLGVKEEDVMNIRGNYHFIILMYIESLL